MTRPEQQRNWTGAWVAMALMIGSLVIALRTPALAQTYQVIHTFTGGDGETPAAGLTPDGHGNFYGTTLFGGTHNRGTVFKMSPHGSSWIVSPLYSFTEGADGGEPQARVIFGPDGSLYGTTSEETTGCGTVYNLRPAATRQSSALANWTVKTLYTIPGLPEGCIPAGDDVIFDQSGNLYVGVQLGGSFTNCYEGCGLIYELTPSGGGWTESVAYEFQGGDDGADPQGVLLDRAGNIVGTTNQNGQYGAGTVFELTPSSGGWQETSLYAFSFTGNGGTNPEAGLIEDAAGNFYGSTSYTSRGGGVIFELSPSNGGWTYTVLYNLPSHYDGEPTAPLTMDAAGNLYGTINSSCDSCPGSIFKLSPGQDGWSYTSLHDFTGGSDGGYPSSTVSIDANGNLFGTASRGGTGCDGIGCGVVWEITP